MPVVWRGPSQLTGQPIMLIVSRSRSKNRKTGDMAQTYILRDTPSTPWQHVQRARKQIKSHKRRALPLKQDSMSAVCGTCPIKELCYVTWEKSVTSTHKAHRGKRIATPAELRRAIRGRPLRMGAAGDPAAVPFEVWQDLLQYADGFTGYTHQWQTADVRFQALLMASTETLEGTVTAQAAGWRTFRVSLDGKARKGEVICPATTRGVTCRECQLCQGTSKKAKHVTIQVHGNMRRRAAGIIE